MIRTDHKKKQATARKAVGQAATELAVFGAILIFLLGTIVRTAVGNSYTQNQNFKTMRMAMLASWKGTLNNPHGQGAPQNTSRNSAQILFIEDRLSPDYNKYGDLDRSPFVASGSGTFSYNVLYPLSDAADVEAALPIMDVYINGQHFPFTQASYVPDLPIKAPANCTAAAGSCAENQCLRNQREWAGGIIKDSSFVTSSVAPITVTNPACLTSAYPTAALQRKCQEQNNACTIFTDLEQAKMFTSNTITGSNCDPDTVQAAVSPTITLPLADSPQWGGFIQYYESSFPNTTNKSNTAFYNPYLQSILKILQSDGHTYKLFYTLIANPGGNIASQFNWQAPECTSPVTKDQALCSTLTLPDANGALFTNTSGEMAYDLQRLGYYTSPPPTCAFPPCQSVAQQFPTTGCSSTGGCVRSYMAWQWAATAGTSAAMIGLNTSNNVYPTYDVDGRLKEVTIYKIWQDSGTTHVAFEDSEGGDIDGTWDTNSCGPKPGLKQNSQIFTFTQNGTYLQINEGKLYNPETGQVVRSANKRDNIDLIQRSIQLSNNTGRFCTTTSPPTRLNCVGNASAAASACSSDPNPVEVCVDETGNNNCFTSANIAQTCYDTNLNVIFIRSRLEDRRGRFWMTNTSGQLKVQ